MTGTVNGHSGILLVDKPAGMTSHGVVARMRRLLNMKKIGHAGTLDPFATGLLIILVGEGTKLSNALMEGEKTYIAKIKLGEKTDTGDLTGEIVKATTYDHITKEMVLEVLEEFTGTITQKPPMYSAIKKDGVPLYRLARKGMEVDREEREVVIKNIELFGFEYPFMTIKTTCSKGTYVRTLAEDVCEALGTCGHLTELRRVKSGPFSIEAALTLSELEEKDDAIEYMISLNESIPMLPKVVVGEPAARMIKNGGRLKAGWVEDVNAKKIGLGEKVKVVDREGSLISIMESDLEFGENICLQPDCIVGKSLRVFNNI